MTHLDFLPHWKENKKLSKSEGVVLTEVTIRHPDAIMRNIGKLYDSGIASDCTLVSRDGKEFVAHRTILSAGCPVFASMFATSMKEKASGVCRMENLDGKAVEALLKYLYTGSLSGIGEFVEDMLGIADQYDLPDLAVACEEYMWQNVQVSTALDYIVLAKRRGLHALKAKLARFIGDNSHAAEL